MIDAVPIPEPAEMLHQTLVSKVALDAGPLGATGDLPCWGYTLVGLLTIVLASLLMLLAIGFLVT